MRQNIRAARDSLLNLGVVKDFEFDYDLSGDRSEINALGTREGIQSTLREQIKGPEAQNYTRRMSELDAALFRRSDAMKQQILDSQKMAT